MSHNMHHFSPNCLILHFCFLFLCSKSVLSPQPQVPKQVFLFNFGLDIQFIIMSEFVTIINNLFLPVKSVL